MYTRILVFFTVSLKNRNISSKIKRSKVTDYAALRYRFAFVMIVWTDSSLYLSVLRSELSRITQFLINVYLQNSFLSKV